LEIPDIQKLLSQAQTIQTDMAKLQEELAAKRVEGSAGGGMVTAIVTGAMRVEGIKIEAALAASKDLEMLQDLITAAVNAALGNAQRMVQDEIQKNNGSMGSLLNVLGGP
jgi:DNA-binding YbaB/EbfC family protein